MDDGSKTLREQEFVHVQGQLNFKSRLKHLQTLVPVVLNILEMTTAILDIVMRGDHDVSILSALPGVLVIQVYRRLCSDRGSLRMSQEPFFSRFPQEKKRGTLMLVRHCRMSGS